MKKFIIVLFSFSMLFMSGCINPMAGLKSAMDSAQDAANTKTLNDARGKTMSVSTANIMTEIDTLTQEIKSEKDAVASSKWPWHPFKNSKIARKETRVKELKSDFSTKLKSDKIYKQYNSDTKSGDGIQNKLKTLLPVILLVLVTIVLFFIFLFKKRIPRNNEPDESEYIEEHKVSKANHSGQLEVDYDALLNNLCDKIGISSDAPIKKFGNSRTAYEKVNQMSIRGMSKKEILNELK